MEEDLEESNVDSLPGADGEEELPPSKTTDESPPPEDKFYENLAEVWDVEFLDALAKDLCESITKDRDARKLRDKQQEDGLKRTGMGDEAPGGADFEGASKVTHPVITTCTIDFAARAIKELHPPEGPVKTCIIGQTTKGRLERAERISNHMNFQLTSQIEEYRPEFERLLTQLPMGGSQYLKLYWDKRLNRPRADFIPIDNMFIPFNASSLYTADRVTHWQILTELEFERRVKTGMYIDTESKVTTANIDKTKSELANEKIEGKSEQDAGGEEGIKEIYEVYTYAENEDDKIADYKYGPCPYVISIDVQEQKIISVYRNWEKGDKTFTALQWIVDFGFIPWRGVYCVGLPHLIGGLSAAATGTLRALLDSAHISNSATALKLKGGRVNGQSVQPSVGQIVEIDGGPIDDIRKIAMPMPFPPPSPVLFQLLGLLDELARGVVRTVLEDQSGSGTEVPVGTQLSRVENGMVVFSAIHSRLHASQRKCFEILFRLNRQYIEDENILDEFGEILVRREDYEGPMDVMPVSDPHIFSESQRFAQNQGLVQMSATAPDLYNMRAVHRRVLKTMRIPDIDEVLITPPEPSPQNPVAENVQLMMGKPAVAFPDQDHLAHIQVLLSCLEDPNYGASQIIAPVFIPGALEHLKQHMAFWYATEMLNIVNEATGINVEDIPYSIDGLGSEFDKTLAQASGLFHAKSNDALKGIPPVITKAMQVLQSMQQQSPQDPNMLVAQAAMKDAQTRGDKLQLEAQDKQTGHQIEAQKVQTDAGIKQAELSAEVQENTEDNSTDLQVALIKAHESSVNQDNSLAKTVK